MRGIVVTNPKVDVVFVITVTSKDRQLARDFIELSGIPLNPYQDFPIEVGRVVERMMNNLDQEAWEALEKIDKEDD